jgi:hypothetical protein
MNAGWSGGGWVPARCAADAFHRQTATPSAMTKSQTPGYAFHDQSQGALLAEHQKDMLAKTCFGMT